MLNSKLNSPVDISSQKSRSQIGFGAGWNAMVSEGVKHCNIPQVTADLEKRGIEADFAGNKVIAWCSDRTVKIFEHLKDRYGLKLGLPKSIYVRDFSDLNINDRELTGFCSWLPARISSRSDKIFPEKSVFFNTHKEVGDMPPFWKNIDSASDNDFERGEISNNHFLGAFMHEFAHVAHNGKLLERLTPAKLFERLIELHSPEFLAKFRMKYGEDPFKIGGFARQNTFDAVAEDMSAKIAGSLDSSTLLPGHNPFGTSPYQKEETLKEHILRKAWNGEDLL